MPEPNGHMFHVAMEVEEPGEAPVLALPVWTPGSYLVREYARHVERMTAEDGEGQPLRVARIDKHRFRVEAKKAARAIVRYRVFAHELSVRTCHLDGTHGFIHGAGLFFEVEGRSHETHELVIEPPTGWSVATALRPAPGGKDPFDPGGGGQHWRFTARDYDELVDSPVEVGTHVLTVFTALGKPHAMAVWGRAGVDLAGLTDDTRRIVEYLGGLMGGPPYERYLFIVHLGGPGRGGLEHASSTSLLLKRAAFYPRDAYEESLALVAHEFFHAWNVKKLRPAALKPYDYAREQYTRLLWWFEGVTSYYDQLALLRVGLLDIRRYLRHLGEDLTTLARSPGADKMSLEEASLLAWVKHYRPDENSGNSGVSYYLKGELVALALDLCLRRAGHTLDELVRLLVERYAQGGLPEASAEAGVADLIGPARARAFFDRLVRGTGTVDLDLESIGLRVRHRPAEGLDDKGGSPPKQDLGRTAGWLGASLASGTKLYVASVQEGSPAWRAGLYAGDEIVAERRFRVDRATLWDRMAECGPDGQLELTVFRRDELVDVRVPLAEAPSDTFWVEFSETPSEHERAAFEAWCGQAFPVMAG
jgi:predicted metalloprotease with PDZ domain